VLASRLQAACLRNTPSQRRSAIYSTLANTALYLLDVSSTGSLAYELKILQVTQNCFHSNLEITPMNRARVSSY